MGEPGGLPSMGSHRVGHDWSDLATAAAAQCKHSFNLHWETKNFMWLSLLCYLHCYLESNSQCIWAMPVYLLSISALHLQAYSNSVSPPRPSDRTFSSLELSCHLISFLYHLFLFGNHIFIRIPSLLPDHPLHLSVTASYRDSLQDRKPRNIG